MKNIIQTIEELYQWAKEKGIENFTVFVNDEGGCKSNIFTTEAIINKEEKTIYL